MSLCTTFVDRTADGASRSIKWDFNVGSTPERCMKIKVGQKAKFTSDGANAVADFGTHPVGANGGDTPNTVTNVDKATGEISFSKAGTFGFQCTVHGAMTGAFQVVE